VTGVVVMVQCRARLREEVRILVAAWLEMWCASNGRLGAGQSDTIGRCRGTVGLGTLLWCREESKACLMAQAERLAWSPPSCPSFVGSQERERREGAGSGLAQTLECGGSCCAGRGRCSSWGSI
jgi:hypothetical protein